MENSNDFYEVSEKILNQSKNTLCNCVHSFLHGINSLEPLPQDINGCATDGKYFFYNPKFICLKYKENKNTVNRLLLHSLLHCMFLHPFNTDFKNKELWDLSCDISVEIAINKWNLPDTKTGKEAIQNNTATSAFKDIKNLTAENIYYALLTDKSIDTDELKDVFLNDVHILWYDSSNGFTGEDEETELVEARSIYKMKDDTRGDSQLAKGKMINDTANSGSKEEAWRKITSQTTKDIESSKGMGESSGIDTQIFQAVSGEKYDYSVFLKRFISVNEALEINDDEFDYIFYTYGLSLYKNMPIIEPLEYSENRKIKKLIIAIDTSGSVRGECVQGFLNKTYDILMNTDFFAHNSEVHIVQCDSQIQDIAIIHDRHELQKYIENTVFHGFGGTDFTPVFDYAKEIYNASGKSDFNGLIYFTDGDGMYPAESPVYKSVFVVHDNGFDKSKAPSWTTLFYMDKLDLIR